MPFMKNPCCGSQCAYDAYVELLEPLPAAEDFSQDAPVATAKLLKVNDDGDLECANKEVAVVNRYSIAFSRCERVAVLRMRDDEWHVVPVDPRHEGAQCADAVGSSLWRVVLTNGRPAWELIESGCCKRRTCACEETATTGEATTTTDECCGYEPIEPTQSITVEDVGLEVRNCCRRKVSCEGSAEWTYSAASGTWSLDSDDCGEGCVPERPTLCPNQDTCTRTDCVPQGCGTTTTTEPCPPGGTTTTTADPGGSTTGEPGTTTCDPSCFQDPAGCVYEPPSCESTCEFVCTRSGWVALGNDCCGSFQIGRPGCPTNPPRTCSRVCVRPSTSCTVDDCGLTASGSCITVCPPAPAPCHGACLWRGHAGGWTYVGGGCSGTADCESGGCGCVAPSGDPNRGPCDPPVYTSTRCTCLGGSLDLSDCECDDEGGDDCCGGPGTPTTPECSGSCTFRWDASGEGWSIDKNSCRGTDCNCVGTPVEPGQCDGQVQAGFCSDEVTEPTEAPTTTTDDGTTTTDDETSTTDDGTSTTDDGTSTTDEGTSTTGDGDGPFGGCCQNIVNSVLMTVTWNTQPPSLCTVVPVTEMTWTDEPICGGSGPTSHYWIGPWPISGAPEPNPGTVHSYVIFWCEGAQQFKAAALDQNKCVIQGGIQNLTGTCVPPFAAGGFPNGIAGMGQYFNACFPGGIGGFGVEFEGT